MSEKTLKAAGYTAEDFTPYIAPSLEIRIPEDDNDVVEGNKCLEYEIPWQVPASIFEEAKHLNENDVVLEFGSGGSTLFFARRCKRVISIETNPGWAIKIRDILHERMIDNVVTIVMERESGLWDLIEEAEFPNVSVLSVDTQGGINRSAILNAVLKKEMPNLKLIILDNFQHESLFPDHYNKIWGDEWEVRTYIHNRWSGSGTRLLIRNSAQYGVGFTSYPI